MPCHSMLEVYVRLFALAADECDIAIWRDVMSACHVAEVVVRVCCQSAKRNFLESFMSRRNGASEWTPASFTCGFDSNASGSGNPMSRLLRDA